MSTITYKRSNYKYQLLLDHVEDTPIKGHVVDCPFYRLDKDGKLWINLGYAWDGPSGPTVDTKDFMRGSLIHDVFYQMMREGQIPLTCKDAVDKLLFTMCREDGMSWFRAKYVLFAVQRYGDSSCSPDSIDEVQTAP